MIRTFTDTFGHEPVFWAQAPGRVNLIGEHTDYNDGLVLPAAIGRYVRIGAAGNGTDRIRLYSSAYGGSAEFDAADPAAGSVPVWARYPQGVAVKLSARGIRLAGVDALIDDDLPIGSGLSSSAALEVASSLVFEHSAGSRLSPRERALLCRAAEVEFVGIPCGIMDQFAVSLCRNGHALFLDCRSLETHHIPLPAGLTLAVCDTGVRRALGDSAYAQRRRECTEAVRWIQSQGRTITSLRDLTPDDLPAVDELPDPLRRRARHVVTENARVVDAARALEGGETDRLRPIFLASHESLRNDYEVSSPELDAMVDASMESPGCVAARMTGAGFGGAVVALVQQEWQGAFLEATAHGYRRRMDRAGVFFASGAVAGAQYEH